jgi:hypothetical protein
MTGPLLVFTGAMVAVLVGWLCVWLDELLERRSDARADRVVGWCADCAEPVQGLAGHLTRRHPTLAEVRCVPCGRNVAADCMDAHRALFHRIRAVGLEDRWTA